MSAYTTLAAPPRPLAPKTRPGAVAAAEAILVQHATRPQDPLAATLARAVRERVNVAGPLLQRTVDDAAKALVRAGQTPNMKLLAYKKWLKEKTGTGHAKQANSVAYGVGEGDFGAVVNAIATIKAGGAAQRKRDETAAKVATSLREAQEEPVGGVSLNRGGVTGYLDADQLPHQPQGIRIGTRVARKAAGSRFGSYATPAWHQANTLVTMTDWAATLGLADGETQNTNQSEARNDNIYYEGFAARSAGQTYVFFHCYPSRDFVHPG